MKTTRQLLLVQSAPFRITMLAGLLASTSVLLPQRAAAGVVQQAYVKPSDTTLSRQFGKYVAIDGDTAVVSNLGSNPTYVFVRNAGVWTQQATLPTVAQAVSISGDTIVVGLTSGNGSARVYVRNAGVWTLQATLTALNAGLSDNFGASVAISGDMVVVGAPFEDSSSLGINSTSNEAASNAGAAYVFVRSGTAWTQIAYVKPAVVGTTQFGDLFGTSVAASGNSFVVGAPFEASSSAVSINESASGSGAAYLFYRNGNSVVQTGYLKAGNIGGSGGNDNFGSSVAISGSTVVVGAPGEDSNTTGVNSTPNESAADAGAVYVFAADGVGIPQQAYLKPAAVGTTQAGDQFGTSVAISGDTLVVGAVFEDSNSSGVNSTPAEGATDSGAAYVFLRASGVWTQQAYVKPAAFGTNQAGDNMGNAVATSGDTVVVGAILEDSSTTGINSTPDEASGINFNSGAAYVFTGAGLPEITVEQPVGVSLVSASSSVSLGGVVLGGNATKTFTITNTGVTGLTLTSLPAVTGGDAGDFSVDTTGTLTTVPAGGSTTFSVTFTPSALGTRSTTLRILNTDADEGTFDIALSGVGFHTQQQYDDNRTAGQNDVINDPNAYNLYTLTQYNMNFMSGQNSVINDPNPYGLYTLSQVQALNADVPLIQKDPNTGKFTLTLGVQKSTDLTTHMFNPFPLDTPGSTTTINAEGKLEFQFTVPDNAAFFRVEAH